jgi:uncharacterized protein YaaQ
MKVIIAILSADAVEPVSRALVDNHFSVTQISSVGGFLRRGSTTLVVGVDEAQLPTALTVMRDVCKPLSKPEGHAATIFVVNASQFVQL